MPNFDGTDPCGEGQKTGRQQGPCAGNQPSQPGLGRGRGRGASNGRGRGLGRWFGFGANQNQDEQRKG